MHTTQETNKSELIDMVGRPDLDIRMVHALAGDRTLNAREMDILSRMKSDRGDNIYSDMLYTLTHRAFPSRQAKHLWAEIVHHRASLKASLGRDVGLSVATHDYLVNVAQLISGVAIIEETKMASLANVANKDGLTGLFDHATFKYKLKEEMERQLRYGGALSLVMFDIDHFKKVNDTFGHAEGDIILKQMAEVVTEQARSMDVVARYGGEEFAVILPQVDLSSALIFAERLRKKVEKTFEDAQADVTISVGIASCKGDASQAPDELVKAADEQLYRAKREGRNRVCKATAQFALGI